MTSPTLIRRAPIISAYVWHVHRFNGGRNSRCCVMLGLDDIGTFKSFLFIFRTDVKGLVNICSCVNGSASISYTKQIPNFDPSSNPIPYPNHNPNPNSNPNPIRWWKNRSSSNYRWSRCRLTISRYVLVGMIVVYHLGHYGNFWTTKILNY